VRRARLALVAALALASPAAAHADIVPGQIVDGPAAEIKSFGGLDMAPDGTGALAYVKAVAGVDHVFVSRYLNGAWQSPEQADTGLADASTFPHVAVGNGGRVLVTFVNKPVMGFGNLRAALATGAGSPFAIASPDATTDTKVSDSDLAMDPVSGVAYVVFTVANMGGDVHAARLSGTTWTPVATVLDNVQADDAAGTGRDNGARVAVDTSGNAVAAWPELDATTKPHVYVRRITGTTADATAVEATIPTLDGHADSALSANHVDMDGGGSASPWVVFRELFAYSGGNNRPRDLARQLVGGALSTAQVIDGLPVETPTEGAEFPRIDVNAAGQGLGVSPRQMGHETFASTLTAGSWSTGVQIDSGTPTGASFPVAAISDSGSGLFAWIDTTGGAAATKVVARQYVGGAPAAQQTLSRDSLGQIGTGGLEAASSAAGNVGVGFAQGAASVAIVAAVVNLTKPAGGGGGGPGGSDKTAPKITALRISRKTFRLGRALPHLSARVPPVGTTLSFTVSEASKTTFKFERVTTGRRVGKRCLAPTKRRAKRRRCTRYVPARPSLVYTTAPGPHKLRFAGRLTRRTKLKPGKYRLSVTSKDSAGNTSRASTIRFRLV